MLLAARDPVPTYVATVDFLGRGDFVSAKAAVAHGEEVIRATLTPGAREKVNQIAEHNEVAKNVEDYMMLLLFVDGEPAKQVTLVTAPIPGFEIDMRVNPARIPEMLAEFNASGAH